MRISPGLALIAGSQFGLAGPLDCSVYALRGPDGMVMIDSGAGTHTAMLLANLREDLGDVPLRAVVLTHCHPDHAAGAALVQKQTGCRVLAPELSAAIVEAADEEASGLAFARAAGVYPADFRLTPCHVDQPFLDGDCFNAAGSDMAGYRADLHKLGGLEIEGLFPGHGLFTLRGGQAHIDCAIQQAQQGFLARQIGQGDLIF